MLQDDKDEITKKLARTLAGPIQDFQGNILDLAIDVCANSKKLVEFCIERGTELLQELGSPAVFVNLLAITIRMAPRAKSTFENIGAHLQNLATSCCGPHNMLKSATKEVSMPAAATVSMLC